MNSIGYNKRGKVISSSKKKIIGKIINEYKIKMNSFNQKDN